MTAFDYEKIKDLSYSQMILYQLSVNFAWLIAIAGILLFVLWFNILSIKKK